MIATDSAGLVAVPVAFHGASEGLAHALKLEVGVDVSEESGRPVIRPAFYTDGAYVDLMAVAPSELQSETLLRDCEIIANVLRTRPNLAAEMLTAYQSSPSGYVSAFSIIKEAGLTERNVVS